MLDQILPLFVSTEIINVCAVLCVCAQLFSHVRLFVAPWVVAQQAPLPMEFSRQEYGAGCHFLLRKIFPTQESNLSLLHLLH